ncbi:calphotin-like [Macrobrachium rosenbergii]|uniref:calphotin-like n=1 Tax=Macrobrachium rosenbergii TaxID=79674 RepID=UPI0034D4DE5B
MKKLEKDRIRKASSRSSRSGGSQEVFVSPHHRKGEERIVSSGSSWSSSPPRGWRFRDASRPLKRSRLLSLLAPATPVTPVPVAPAPAFDGPQQLVIDGINTRLDSILQLLSKSQVSSLAPPTMPAAPTSTPLSVALVAPPLVPPLAAVPIEPPLAPPVMPAAPASTTLSAAPVAPPLTPPLAPPVVVVPTAPPLAPPLVAVPTAPPLAPPMAPQQAQTLSVTQQEYVTSLPAPAVQGDLDEDVVQLDLSPVSDELLSGLEEQCYCSQEVY